MPLKDKRVKFNSSKAAEYFNIFHIMSFHLLINPNQNKSDNVKLNVLITPPRNRGGVIFSLQFVSVSVCLCMCVSVCPDFLWTKFQPNGCTDLDAVFAKWLLTALALILLKLVILGQRSRSQWLNIHISS